MGRDCIGLHRVRGLDGGSGEFGWNGVGRDEMN